ncbi:MAG: hypothetical protein E3J90_12740 [Promethearchaeota archaeon]|nr:MAG: hypothetical protein E3J90_12740 [Candidatus Lokiarchaeota archaeon]
MYPNSTKSLLKETKGSYSLTVSGIVILILALSFGLAIMGIWEGNKNGNNQTDYNMPFISKNQFLEESSSDSEDSEVLSKEILPSSEISEDIFSEEAILGSSDVPVPESGCFDGFDTVAGKMEIFNPILPDPTVDLLPLCLDDAWLDQWSLTVGTLGGYNPVDGCIEVYQEKEGDPNCIPIGYIEIEYSLGYASADPAYHGWVFYDLTFKLFDAPDGALPHPIVLDSNHVPDSIGSPFWLWDGGYLDLDKFVDFKISTTWEGCRLPEQQFMVILAHKVMSQIIIPNSR